MLYIIICLVAMVITTTVIGVLAVRHSIRKKINSRIERLERGASIHMETIAIDSSEES